MEFAAMKWPLARYAKCPNSAHFLPKLVLPLRFSEQHPEKIRFTAYILAINDSPCLVAADFHGYGFRDASPDSVSHL
jgi:hypothetical protein